MTDEKIPAFMRQVKIREIHKQPRAWIVVWQPSDADQFDHKTMTVIDCWLGDSDYKAAYAEMNRRLYFYLIDNDGAGKISLFEGDRQANFLWPFMSEKTA
jgi:hypothetical protein